MRKNFALLFARSISLLVGKGSGIVLLILGIMIPQESLGYDLAGLKIVKNEKRSVFALKGSDNKYVGQVTVSLKSEFPKLKVSAEPEALVIDSRELFTDQSKKQKVMLHFHRFDRNLIVRASADGKNPSEINRFTMELQSDAPSQLYLLFEGTTETDGKRKHYWRQKPVMLTGKRQTVSFDQFFPANLKTLQLRFDQKNPCRLEIRKILFEKVPLGEKKIDASINHILNGGAEREWTGIFYRPLRFYQDAATGKYFDYRKKEIKNEVKVFLDPDVKYQGDFSFRIEVPKGESTGSLQFNPVPYAWSKPSSFSFYAKAEKESWINIEYFQASGHAIVSPRFKIGTSWKKYEFYMPAFGAKQKGVNLIRVIPDHSIKFLRPGFLFRTPGKVWIDNVAYSVGGHAVYKEIDSFFVTHKLSKDKSYYFADEKIKAELLFRNASKDGFSGIASYKLIDVFGKQISSKGIGKISVPANQSEKQTVEFQLPPDFRGPFHAVFEVKSGDKTYSDAAYAGVIDRGGKLNRRIGLELYARQNFGLLPEYLKDFRIGCIRIGYASAGGPNLMENAELMKKNGFDIMFGTGIPRAIIKDPVRWKALMDAYEQGFAKYGKYIDIIESDNEANITGVTTEQNRQQIRELHDIIKKHDLKCKLAGPTTCHTDMIWTANILSSPEGKLLDIVTEHPYRTLPELPDYADDVVTMRKVIDLYTPGLPHYASESGRKQPYMPENGGFVSEYTITMAARDMRNIIQGFSAEVKRYYHFTCNMVDGGISYNVLYGNTPANNCMPRPNPAFYALRALSDRLEQAECVKRIRLGIDYRCPVFDHGSKRTAVIWKWNGNSGSLTFDPEDAKHFTAYNFFGAKIPADKLEMNEYPIYLDTALSAADAEKAIRRATLISEDSSPIEFTPMILGENRFAVEVLNRTGNDLKDIKVSVDTPNAVSGEAEKTIASVGPEAKVRADFELKQAISTKDRKLKVSVREAKSNVKKTEELNLRAVFVKKAEKPLVIDGDLSDWQKNVDVVKLDKQNAVKLPNAVWGENEDKARVELQYAWDESFLYMAVTVFKPEFHFANDENKVLHSWKFDSVQVAYDTLRNAKPGTSGFGDDDFEYTFAECGGKPFVIRHRSSSAIHDSLTKSVGVLRDEVEFAVKKYEDRVVYEMAFPKRSVSPFKLAPYSVMRAGFLVNINNGKERAGWLELTPGIGQHPKRPDQWMDLVLVE